LARHLRPIPKWLAKHQTYIKHVKVLLDNAELELMQPFQRLSFVKKQLRDASALALKEIVNKPAKSKPERHQALITCGRAIWHNQSSVVRKALVAVLELQDVVMISHCGNVQLVKPGKFNDLLCSAMTEHLALELAELETPAPSCKTLRRGRNACIRHFQKLCRRFDTRLQVDGVRTAEGVIVEPIEKTHVLAEAWGETSSLKAIDEAAAERYAALHQTKMNFDEPPPDIADIEWAASHARDSAPGPDGLRFSCWVAVGEAGYKTLFLVILDLFRGNSPLPWYNDSYVVMPPKGEADGDELQVIRTPTETRPIN
jgi:hypothetical protein